MNLQLHLGEKFHSARANSIALFAYFSFLYLSLFQLYVNTDSRALIALQMNVVVRKRSPQAK